LQHIALMPAAITGAVLLSADTAANVQGAARQASMKIPR